MFVIGSGAVCGYGIDFRSPKDNDFIVMEDEFFKIRDDFGDDLIHEQTTKWGKVLFVSGQLPMEFEIGKDGNLTEQLIKIVKDNNLHNGTSVHPVVVYTMKMSHRYLKNSKHFKKCMDDIRSLRVLGHGVIPDCLQDWYKARMKATYDYGHPSLKQGKDAFFSDDGVNYVYDHDTIHETVKLFDRPAFELIKEDGAEVFCSKAKFFSSPEELKMATVLEETYVLALERSQIPNNFEPTRRASFTKALEKVCTSISSGYWREYAWENYEAVLAAYSEDYVDKFKAGLAAGVVKEYRS